MKKRYALIIELGRIFLLCSKYDRMHKPKVAMSARRAAGSEARVFREEWDVAITFTIWRMQKMERRICLVRRKV